MKTIDLPLSDAEILALVAASNAEQNTATLPEQSHLAALELHYEDSPKKLVPHSSTNKA